MFKTIPSIMFTKPILKKKQTYKRFLLYFISLTIFSVHAKAFEDLTPSSNDIDRSVADLESDYNKAQLNLENMQRADRKKQLDQEIKQTTLQISVLKEHFKNNESIRLKYLDTDSNYLQIGAVLVSIVSLKLLANAIDKDQDTFLKKLKSHLEDSEKDTRSDKKLIFPGAKKSRSTYVSAAIAITSFGVFIYSLADQKNHTFMKNFLDNTVLKNSDLENLDLFEKLKNKLNELIQQRNALT